MRARLLGHVAASSASGEVPLGGPKQRTVFAVLALNVGRAVSLDRLVYELWRDAPPAQATVTLQGYVSRLRRSFADRCHDEPDPPRIVTKPPGWELHLPAEGVGACVFETALLEARSLAADGLAAASAERVRQGLALWSGEALSGLDQSPFVSDEQERLTQLRLSAAEALLECDLARGAAREVVEAATQFVAQNPFRERAWCALILALQLSGRQAEALAEVGRLRSIMAADLGLDPGPEVATLEQRILRHDPELVRDVGGASSAVAAVGTARTPPDDEDACPSRITGRADALAAIDASIERAMRGAGSLLILRGTAGMGKTALVVASCTAGKGSRRARGAGCGLRGRDAVDELIARGVLIAVAARPAESALRDRLADVLDRPRAEVTRVGLTGLTEPDVATMVEDLSAANADPEVVVAIQARTGGNPLFVTEMVRLLISERRLDPSDVYSRIQTACATC